MKKESLIYSKSHYKLLKTKDIYGVEQNLDLIRKNYILQSIFRPKNWKMKYFRNILNLAIFAGNTKKLFFTITKSSSTQKISDLIDASYNVTLDDPAIISMKNLCINENLVVFDKNKIYTESLNDYDSIDELVIKPSKIIRILPFYQFLRYTKFFIILRKKQYLKKQIRKKKVILDEEAPVYLLLDYSCFNFTHFLLEMMPKIYLLKDKIKNGKLIVPQSKKGSRFHDLEHLIPILKAFGLESNERINVQNSVLEIKQLVMVSKTKFHKELFNDALNSLVRFYENKVHEAPYIEKLYIARKNGRNFANLEEVENIVCKKYGFTKVYMEDYTIPEKITLMKNVKYIMSIYSAGLTNIIFVDRK